LKFIKGENEKLRERVKTLEAQHLQGEHKMHAVDAKAQEVAFAVEDTRR
jgi:hypothetical protein